MDKEKRIAFLPVQPSDVIVTIGGREIVWLSRVLGVLLLISLSLGVVLFQQTVRQRELRDQVAKLTLTVNQPMSSAEKLKAEYEEVLNSTPPPDPKVLLAMIVEVARGSGIDVSLEGGKFLVPAQSVVWNEVMERPINVQEPGLLFVSLPALLNGGPPVLVV